MARLLLDFDAAGGEQLLDGTSRSRRSFAGVADAEQAQQESNFILRFEGDGGMVHRGCIG